MNTGLESLGSDLRVWYTDLVRDRIIRGAIEFRTGWNQPGTVPVKSGTFRGSAVFWVGEESGEVPTPSPFMAPRGESEIREKMAGFHLGDRAGFIERQPYTGYLLAGGSAQAPDLPATLLNLVAEVVAT